LAKGKSIFWKTTIAEEVCERIWKTEKVVRKRQKWSENNKSRSCVYRCFGRVGESTNCQHARLLSHMQPTLPEYVNRLFFVLRCLAGPSTIERLVLV
jgi:hypothetical protein